jgi:hypothetical protein
MLLNSFYTKIGNVYFSQKDNHKKSLLPVIATDTRNGVSYEVTIGTIQKKSDRDNAGILCSMEDGTEYLELYLN